MRRCLTGETAPATQRWCQDNTYNAPGTLRQRTIIREMYQSGPDIDSVLNFVDLEISGREIRPATNRVISKLATEGVKNPKARLRIPSPDMGIANMFAVNSE